jgi:gas vesicle protein
MEMFLTAIVAIVGITTNVLTAIGITRNWRKESQERTQRMFKDIDDLKDRVEQLKHKDSNQSKFVEAICSSMLAILEHNINGNSVDKLKKAKEDLQEFLIHRG